MLISTTHMPVDTVPGRKAPEKGMTLLRVALKEVFPELSPSEIEGLIGRLIMFASDEKGLADYRRLGPPHKSPKKH